MEWSAYHPFRSAVAKECYLALYDRRATMWPIESESKTVDTAYGETFVRISGPASAPPLVLLPGAATTSLMWAPNIIPLSEGFQTFAVDNIYDYGRSVYRRPFKGPADFVDWLDGLFDALRLKDRIRLMGLSYGGWLVCQYGLRHPDRLSRIVLLAPGATVLPIRSAFLLRGLASLLPIRSFTEGFLNWLFRDLAANEAGRTLLKEAVDDVLVARRCFKAKRPVVPTVLKDDAWRSLRVPTLFLVGANEKIYSAEKAIQRLHDVAPQIQAEIIPGAGHDLSIVQAERVNERVLSFLQGP
jgi:pimeloyl-ACP methyl ester carboxylesterase